jgi:hypothetical protein
MELPQPPAPEGDDADVEPRLSPRERVANRAFRAAVFGLAFAPLLIYAGALLIRMRFVRGPLEGRARRRAMVATLIVLALPAISAVFIVLLLVPRDPRADLREFPHPPEMVGVWEGVLQDPAGETRIEIRLRGDATMRYRESGASTMDCRGYWCYADRRLYLQATRVKEGGQDWLERLVSWRAHMPNENELVLEICSLKRVAAR